MNARTIRIVEEHVPAPSQNGAAPDEPYAHITNYVEQLDIAQMLSEPLEPIEWLWGSDEAGYIERATVNCLHGFGGLGKSLITGTLALAITLGGRLLDQECAKGRVLIIDAENPRREIKRRTQRLRLDPDATRYLRASGPILSAGFEKWLELEILDHKADLVILDSQRGLYPGDEKEANEMRLFYSALRRIAEETDAAILVIHHDNKGRDFSGSTDIDASVDTRMHLHVDDKDEDIVYLKHAKCRQAKRLPEVKIEIIVDSTGVYITSKGERQKSPGGRPASKLPTVQTDILEILVRADGPMTRSQIAYSLNVEHNDSTLRRAWTALQNAGEIIHIGGGQCTLKT